MKAEENQLSEALQKSDVAVDLTYSELGQVYRMLTLMKKIVRHREAVNMDMDIYKNYEELLNTI